MEGVMLLVPKEELEKLYGAIERLNNNFENLNLNKQDAEFLTRREVAQRYDMSERETAKLFTRLLKDKVVDIGKEQRLAKEHIDNLFRQGVVSK